MLKKMSRISCFALLSLLAIGLSGCKSVPMPKGNSKGYSTVRFIAPNAPIGADNSPRYIEANRMIKESIAAQMEKNGLKMVEGNADLIAAHLVILQDNVSTSYSNQYFGLQDFSELVELAHKKGTSKSYPENVQKRALVIDLIDAKTYKLVYRDFVVGGTLEGLPSNERQEQISKAVAQALQKFFK